MSLPGADELFRTTGGSGLQSPAPRKTNGPAAANGGGPGGAVNGDAPRVPAPGGPVGPAETVEPSGSSESSVPSAPSRAEETNPRRGEPDGSAPAEHGGRGAEAAVPKGRRRQESASADATDGGTVPARRRGRGANRRPSGRERHDEKITVYVSAEELMDLEHARLVLRGEHGLAVDRGRIVREAVAVVLADLESRGDASILVRRLRGR
ncbi:hypothetical protein CP973_12845 [Streptomyces albofaciens JCM 4342]|uniref:hypothetical protein n=1 Tax=Streptomyces albofaciens TaxID=66866 RepID=UPI001238EA6B|nr:hypothetical protein [Streptomyces albofaciens]KAA6222702.1 hypothetical protein CP973_12845 [Streptomyces albofaciens JCM 4342]